MSPLCLRIVSVCWWKMKYVVDIRVEYMILRKGLLFHVNIYVVIFILLSHIGDVRVLRNNPFFSVFKIVCASRFYVHDNSVLLFKCYYSALPSPCLYKHSVPFLFSAFKRLSQLLLLHQYKILTYYLEILTLHPLIIMATISPFVFFFKL